MNVDVGECYWLLEFIVEFLLSEVDEVGLLLCGFYLDVDFMEKLWFMIFIKLFM